MHVKFEMDSLPERFLQKMANIELQVLCHAS